MGHESRTGVKDGKDRVEDDQVDVWCFPERKTDQHYRSLGVEAIGDVMRRGRLRWPGHVERKDNGDYAKACTRLVVEGKAWQNALSADMRLMKVDSPGRPRPKEMEGHRTA